MASKYAIIENGIVVNVAEAEAQFAEQQGWIECAGAGPGWRYVDGVFLPPSKNIEEEAQKLRAQRDEKLAASDWRVIKAIETSATLDPSWAAYRQALRDITAQARFPEDVTWPTEPQ